MSFASCDHNNEAMNKEVCYTICNAIEDLSNQEASWALVFNNHYNFVLQKTQDICYHLQIKTILIRTSSLFTECGKPVNEQQELV